jgi:hypothetical protein
VPPSATIVVPGSSANAVRVTAGEQERRYRRGIYPIAVELEHGAPVQDEVELSSESDSSCPLMIRSRASRPVHAVTPKPVMPK